MVLPESMVPDKFPDPPVTPKDAATVVLLRDTAAGLEAFLLRRVMGMAFAGGMSVFPGGGVDQRDADVAVAWTGPDAEWWAERFDCPVPLARALVCAAVRETFEESGVLLAGPSASSVVSDTAPYASARKSLVDREFSLAQFLAGAGLVLRADLLQPWANWITPAEEPRRYDTKFFIAALPEGQRADGSTSEADHAEWRRPTDAIALWKAGERGLLPPTWMTLADLAEMPTVADAMAADRTISKIIPKVIREGHILRPVLPGDPAYPQAANHLDAHPDDTLGR
ncbi:NUDIX hydrolase [Actinocrispum sp. NPDC049592]|uniref:NUDIX hydrolase n=1 Tax=Actinocrispum sp. NPDC049592 TaxID=3154835 RepID=UPI003413DE3E